MKEHQLYVSTRVFWLIFSIGVIINTVTFAADAPALPLANTYQQQSDIEEYWASEKLDGVRAYWDGSQLLSKQGNRYFAPEWFTTKFPDQPLDGELWIKRGQFEQLVSTVRQQQPDDEQWRKVRYMVFDLPLKDTPFTERLNQLKALITKQNSRYLMMVEQFRLADHQALMDKLDEIVQLGGEGLMLHKGRALYQAGRSDNLLKVKQYQDAEAKVIAHLPGQGKYLGMLGSLLVEREDGMQFRLGSGLSDQQRRTPPPVGSLVTYKYYGLTRNGLPRFASFVRVREDI